jgi:hypothetical protein
MKLHAHLILSSLILTKETEEIDVILSAFSGLLVLMHSPTYSTFGRSLMIVVLDGNYPLNYGKKFYDERGFGGFRIT